MWAPADDVLGTMESQRHALEGSNEQVCLCHMGSERVEKCVQDVHA